MFHAEAQSRKEGGFGVLQDQSNDQAGFPRLLVLVGIRLGRVRLFRLTWPVCHIIVSRMRTTTIRELKHATSTVLSWVAAGESVEVRRRRQPVAMLMPLKRKPSVARPDFVARMEAIYGAVRLPTTATELVAEARGER